MILNIQLSLYLSCWDIHPSWTSQTKDILHGYDCSLSHWGNCTLDQTPWNFIFFSISKISYDLQARIRKPLYMLVDLQVWNKIFLYYKLKASAWYRTKISRVADLCKHNYILYCTYIVFFSFWQDTPPSFDLRLIQIIRSSNCSSNDIAIIEFLFIYF